MWGILYAAFAVALFFICWAGVLLLGLTAPLWIGFLAFYIGASWLVRGLARALS